MKIRAGFISNSSTASFVVKTRPTEWDKTIALMDKKDEKDLFVLPPEKIELLKKCGFVPTTEDNPFRKELNTCMGDYDVKPDTDDDTILGFWIVCNHLEVMEFLVANDIPFKASAHYSHYLYSYDHEDEYIYVLQNFGMEYMNNPKKLEEQMSDLKERSWRDFSPLRKINKKEFLKNYDEESSKKIMKDI